MPRTGKSLKLTSGEAKALRLALDRIQPHIAAAAESWPLLKPEQRQELLAHSPLLARLLDMTRPFGGA